VGGVRIKGKHYKRAGKYFFTKQLALLLARLPHPVPLPEGEGVLPNLWGLKVLLDSSACRRESLSPQTKH